MKAITEERLRRFRETCDPRDRYALDTLIKECQELDTLTVTKLRPMCEAPIETAILAFNGTSFAIVDSTFGKAYNKLFEGWLPMPTYKPEKK